MRFWAERAVVPGSIKDDGTAFCSQAFERLSATEDNAILYELSNDSQLVASAHRSSACAWPVWRETGCKLIRSEIQKTKLHFEGLFTLNSVLCWPEHCWQVHWSCLALSWSPQTQALLALLA